MPFRLRTTASPSITSHRSLSTIAEQWGWQFSSSHFISGTAALLSVCIWDSVSNMVLSPYQKQGNPAFKPDSRKSARAAQLYSGS